RMARDACGAVDMRGSDESKPSMNHRNTVKRYRSPKKLKRLPWCRICTVGSGAVFLCSKKRFGLLH
ncbi:hypothetical protein, partial [Rhizobium leguminosarum]|uniref:hypothetical protein n=1 Tax=Rhizobium leguminosarum TaxID=384 RepID=UPI001C9742BC